MDFDAIFPFVCFVAVGGDGRRHWRTHVASPQAGTIGMTLVVLADYSVAIASFRPVASHQAPPGASRQCVFRNDELQMHYRCVAVNGNFLIFLPCGRLDFICQLFPSPAKSHSFSSRDNSFSPSPLYCITFISRNIMEIIEQLIFMCHIPLSIMHL